MNIRQIVTTLLYATTFAAVARGAEGSRHRHGHGGGTALGSSRHFPQGGHVPQNSDHAGALETVSHGRHHSMRVEGGQATSGATRLSHDNVSDTGGGPSQSSIRITAHMREGIKRSFVEDGNNLGDRLAEGIVTRLVSWPKDRPLWIYKPRQGGGYETVRTYPDFQPSGKPVRLLLENNVYVAFDEQRGPPGEDVLMAAPKGDRQRGNSFYLAVRRALSVAERRDVGMSTREVAAVSALRNEVAVFSDAPANNRLMTRLFGLCERDTCWLNARQPLTSSCEMSDRETTIGPADANVPFVFNIYVHNDVTWNTDRIMEERLDWWLHEMSGVLPPDARLHLRIIRGAKGISDLDYVARSANDMSEGDNQYKGYHAFRDALGQGVPCPGRAGAPREYHLLLTGQRPYTAAKESTFGMALDHVAVACLDRPQTVGHEFGHLLGATHEEGKSLPVGLWRYCVTAMLPWSPSRRSAPPCTRYSDKNRETIRETLRAAMPKAPRPERAPTSGTRRPRRSGQRGANGFG